MAARGEVAAHGSEHGCRIGGVAPFLFGFSGVARGFYMVIGAAVLVVVACTRREEGTLPGGTPVVAAPGKAR